MRYRIRYRIQCFICFKFLTSASFADSYSDCSITGTLPVLLQQPDSIATPCFPIQPRLASPPITGLPWNFLGVHRATTRRRHPTQWRSMLKIVARFESSRVIRHSRPSGRLPTAAYGGAAQGHCGTVLQTVLQLLGNQ